MRFLPPRRRRFFEARPADSPTRRTIRTSIREGISSNIHVMLLGGALQTAFLLYLGFSPTQIGLIVAIPQFAALIQIAVAFGMQRWQNRRLIFSTLNTVARIGWALTGLIPVLLPENLWFPVYVAVILVVFLFGQAAGIIWTSLIADAIPTAVRGRFFGIKNSLGWAAACLALLLGGQVMERLPGIQGFAVLFIAGGIVAVWNSWEMYRHPNPPFQPSENGMSYKLLLRPLLDRSFLYPVLFLVVFMLIYNMTVPLFSYVMLDGFGFGYGEVTLITLIHNLVLMGSYYFWGLMNNRFTERGLLLWIFPILGISCLLWLGLAALPALLVLLVSHILLGFGLGGYNLIIFNFLIGDTPKSERPMYIAMFYTLVGVSGFVGPIAGGWLFDRASSERWPTWLFDYGLIAISGALMLLLSLAVGRAAFRKR